MVYWARAIFDPNGHNMNNIGEGPLVNGLNFYTKYKSSVPCGSRQEDIEADF